MDRILSGGLRLGGLHLAVGEPGTGKTVLAHQIGSTRARAGGSILYLTALTESHQTILSQARTFTFFDPERVLPRFYYASLYPALHRGGLGAVSEEIGSLIQQRESTFIAVDGLHTLKAAADSLLDFHRFLNTLQGQAMATGATMLALANYDGGPRTDPHFTLSDAIFKLGVAAVGQRVVRTFTVQKLRGLSYIGGVHPFVLAADGIRIYPRLEAVAAEEMSAPAAPEPTCLPIGVPGLDTMLGGGVTAGSTTLALGVPGAGKTLLGLAFLATGARLEQDGILLAFGEAPEQLVTKAESAGIPLRRAVESGRIRILWRPPAEWLADELAAEILDLVAQRPRCRLVIDGLEQLRQAIPFEERTPAFLGALFGIVGARGAVAFITHGLPHIFGTEFSLPIWDRSGPVDNILLLRYVEIRARLRRFISVLKVREHGYDTAIREFTITPQGIRIGEPFDQAEQLLSGFARVRPTTESEA